MKYIKLFEQHLTKANIHAICKKYYIKNYTINNDMSIDVDGHVNLDGFNLSKLPLTFNRIDGYFSCMDNNLTDLDGSPRYVSGNFHCGSNKITTLIGCPQEVGGFFVCNTNQISSLIGGPIYVGANIDCRSNPLPDGLIGYVDIKLVLKYQEEYGIWNNDGSFNSKRLEILKKDIANGTLT